jgi:hypothetical protein
VRVTMGIVPISRRPNLATDGNSAQTRPKRKTAQEWSLLN